MAILLPLLTAGSITFLLNNAKHVHAIHRQRNIDKKNVTLVSQIVTFVRTSGLILNGVDLFLNNCCQDSLDIK